MASRGYVRISWDEALDIVANEIKRQRTRARPRRDGIYHSSHHQWGNVGYYLSALLRFGNLVGFTRVHLNPDSWEGWYWGALHHWGNSLRVGVAGTYGTVEDCLQGTPSMIVFWSSDPETHQRRATRAPRAPSGGCGRRSSASSSSTSTRTATRPRSCLGGRWIPIRPGTDAALAIAIMYVWITRGPVRPGVRGRSARRASTSGATT